MKRRPPPLTTRQADLAQTLHEALRLHRLGILDHAEQHYRAVLAVRPHHFDAQHLLGVLCLQLGRTDEALVLIRAALKLNPRSTVALSNFGLALRKAGRSQEALASFGKALAITPGDPELLANSGSVLLELGRPEEALASYDRAIATLPGNAGLHNDRGNTQHKLGRFEEALVSYNKALAIQPNHYEALNNRGNVLAELGFIDKALGSYEESNRIAPGNADIFNNRGNVLRKLERHQEALALYQRALSINPDHPVALYNCGAAQLALNRPEEALPPLQKALRIRPDYGDVHVALATTFLALRRPDKALESVNLALQTKPGDADVLNKRGIALEDLNRPEEALADYDKALAIKPDFPAALHNRGNALKSLKRPDEALISYQRAIAIQPDDIKTLTSLAFLQNQNCEWNDLDSIHRSVLLSLQLATFDSSPFPVLSMFDDPVVQRDASKQYVQKCKIQAGPPLWRAHSHRLKIRLAYLSADFKAHAVSYLIPELIEQHDRSKFDVYGFSVGQSDGSSTARRLERAFDEFVEASALSDLSLAQRISDADVDILIDLGGHTKDSRILALSHRPAPIQVTYLGYPATTGASFIDYAIVDSYVVPQTFAEYFTENLAYLPDCFQCNDRRRRISETVPIRSECGLPSDAFVFCSVNNGFKLNPQVFDVWARILLAVPGSVLWLVGPNTKAQESLRREISSRGIDADRLVFAAFTGYENHLARLRLADLYLDTWPYNSGTTASDALWVGLPVLTYSGRSFAARMAGSLLLSVGLPDLIAKSTQDYEALAILLATQPERLADLCQRLERNRMTTPLFDTDRFRNGLEAIYERMWAAHLRGEAPKTLSLTD